MKKLYSTKPHRNAERINAASELAGCALKTINQIAELPCKVAQMITSGYFLFSPSLKPHERALQLIKALLSAAQSIFLCYIWFDNDRCSHTNSDVCKTLLVLDLIYQGVLACSWGGAELFKDDCQQINIHIDDVHIERGVKRSPRK